jgi:hypothetical protein
MERDISLKELGFIELLHERANTTVELISYNNKNYVLKSFIKEELLKDENKRA